MSIQNSFHWMSTESDQAQFPKFDRTETDAITVGCAAPSTSIRHFSVRTCEMCGMTRKCASDGRSTQATNGAPGDDGFAKGDVAVRLIQPPLERQAKEAYDKSAMRF